MGTTGKPPMRRSTGVPAGKAKRQAFAVSSSVGVDETRVGALRQALLAWFAHNGVELPWRSAPTPYAVLVSEIMLQQTQRARVVPKFLAFMETFPTLEALAQGTTATVIRAWAGLGYNRRALRLHTIARAAVERGGLPSDLVALRELPGIGPYTAGAIACFAFGAQVAFVDTNVRRVLRRVLLGQHGDEGTASTDLALAAAALPDGGAVGWNAALMDLGALYCRARAPLCGGCPVGHVCLGRGAFAGQQAGGVRANGQADASATTLQRVAEPRARYGPAGDGNAPSRRFEATDRFLRGRIVQALRDLPSDGALTLDQLAGAATGHALPLLPLEVERVAVLAARLQAEGLIEIVGENPLQYTLPS